MEDAKALLEARVRDAFEIAEERCYAKFTPFLNEDEVACARRLIERQRYAQFLFFGGSEGCARQMLGAFPSFSDPDPSAFPIAAVTVEYPAAYSLSHRDFLGCLMGLQVKRDAVGDIFTGEGWGVIFLRDSVQGLVLDSLTKVGRVGVKVFPGALHDLPKGASLQPVTGTVASLRLDSVVSLAARVSREKAAALVQLGQVMVNHEVVQSNSLALKAGDVLSIRGCGKFILSDEINRTKKGRLFVTVNKYI